VKIVVPLLGSVVFLLCQSSYGPQPRLYAIQATADFISHNKDFR